jgi:hypothetical protein
MTDTQYDYIELQLDSAAATKSNSSLSIKNNPLFVLGRQISNVTGIKVMEVEIPFSYYVIDGTSDASGSNNNNLIIPAYGTAIGAQQIEITPGQYTATTLVTELNSKFTALGASLVPTVAPIVASFNVSTGKLTFTCTAAFSLGVNGYSPALPMYDFLGLPNSVVTATLSGGSYSIVAPYVAQITGADYIYINSKLLGPITKCWLPESTITGVTGQTNPQFAKISVNCNPGGVINWADPDPNYWFDTQNLFQLLNIDLYLTLGNSKKPLDLNGLGFSVKIALQINTNQLNQGFAGTTGQDRVSKRVRMV